MRIYGQRAATTGLAPRKRAFGKDAAYRLGLAGLTAALLPLSFQPVRAQAAPPPEPSRTATLTGLQDAFSALADLLEPTVVTVSSTKTGRNADSDSELPRGLFPFGKSGTRRSVGTGSGVIIRADGWVLTNDHVVGGADRVTVKLHDGREFEGTVRRDYRSDLALIKINATSPLPFARLGDSDKTRIGHWAIAIGSPYRHEGSFSVGVISSLNRSQQIPDFSASVGQGRLYPDLIQTDAAINPGNSGGPLCNINGEVIGINTAIESEGGGSVGIGFAIPVNAAKFVIDQLLAKGKVSWGYLGILPRSVTPRIAAALKVDQGAYLDREPEAGSPAGLAGLRAGDVITKVGTRIVRDERDMRTFVAQTPPGTTVELAIVREGQPQVLKATIQEFKEATPPDKPRDRSRSHLGIEVQALTKDLASEAHVPVKTAGVYVKSIDQATLTADYAETLTEGAVIVRVNGKETPTLQAYLAATADLKSGDQVKIYYLSLEEGVGLVRHFVVVPVD